MSRTMTSQRVGALYVAMTLLLAPPSVAETYISQGLSVSRLGSISLAVFDSAKGGCWTNIGEVKQYAEDKIAMLKLTISDASDFRILIDVHAIREERTQICFGDIEVILEGKVGHVWATLAAADDTIAFTSNNLNNYVLDSMAAFFRDLEVRAR